MPKKDISSRLASPQIDAEVIGPSTLALTLVGLSFCWSNCDFWHPCRTLPSKCYNTILLSDLKLIRLASFVVAWVPTCWHGDHCPWYSYPCCNPPWCTCPPAASRRRERLWWISSLLLPEQTPWWFLIHGGRVMTAACGSSWCAKIAPAEYLISTSQGSIILPFQLPVIVGTWTCRCFLRFMSFSSWTYHGITPVR